MMLRQFPQHLRRQNWTSILIELLIVVVGVFIGNWVNDWSQQRSEQRDVEAIIDKLDGDVARRLTVVRANHAYYDVTARFAKTALAGWANDPTVSDRDFVIAAYQASQVVFFNTESQTYNLLLGADQVRKIRNIPMRDAIIGLLNYNFEPIGPPSVRTRYRDDVRSVIPDDIQAIVRKQCGDYQNAKGVPALPEKCDVVIPEASAKAGAMALRAHPELVGELYQHNAQIATFLYNVDLLRRALGRVQAQLDRRAAQ